MLLAVFLLHLAAGLYCFLPLVGRRNAGVKFYRLVLITCATLALGALAAHWMAGRRELAAGDGAIAGVAALTYLTLRYPKRLIFKASAMFLAIIMLATAVASFHSTVKPSSIAWSIAGSLTSLALLGSVNLAMLLGHWYLVVRGMPIDPLRRLTIATLIATVAKIAVVVAAIIAAGVFREVAVRHGIFFWMRVGWGLAGPLLLYPMVWGTVKIRSTMAATGILYVDVVAVIIGEVLGVWLSTMVRVPV